MSVSSMVSDRSVVATESLSKQPCSVKILYVVPEALSLLIVLRRPAQNAEGYGQDAFTD
jgi:hypothetical protein